MAGLLTVAILSGAGAYVYHKRRIGFLCLPDGASQLVKGLSSPKTPKSDA
jgi:hypothetical protein